MPIRHVGKHSGPPKETDTSFELNERTSWTTWAEESSGRSVSIELPSDNTIQRRLQAIPRLGESASAHRTYRFLSLHNYRPTPQRRRGQKSNLDAHSPRRFRDNRRDQGVQRLLEGQLLRVAG